MSYQIIIYLKIFNFQEYGFIKKILYPLEVCNAKKSQLTNKDSSNETTINKVSNNFFTMDKVDHLKT